ncbi:hypothetical protein PR048_027860 [Dryococelus australis]|uniref:DUF4371 domain-containing protein n=1 Tax=Dryococelus australis TaxID=614101 RepID=A0ABQ9GHL3_9NEOP|nr:hypothetical protein PR048_027860 [Dryococelus australis]
MTREKELTNKMLHTAYTVAKKNWPFYNFEDEINLQELNGIDMGRILHSTNACINIVNHSGKEMRKVLVNKMSIIIDESTSVSQKSMLIVHIRVLIKRINLEESLNLFTDLIELECVNCKRNYFQA